MSEGSPISIDEYCLSPDSSSSIKEYCEGNEIRSTILGHNRAFGSSIENRDVFTHYTARIECTQDVSVENPNLGKTTTALRLQGITM